MVGLVLCGVFMSLAAGGAEIVAWGSVLDAVKQDTSLAADRDTFVELAREAAAKPIVQRAKTLAEIGQHRTALDGRANALEDEIRETFALAMSDFSACNGLSDELPLLAAAFRLTQDDVFKDRVIAQLSEMASWAPLQRPGWTLYHPGARLPADGRDGNWLATGVGIRAIADALDLMPGNAVDAALRARLEDLLKREIANIVDDWQTKRPWFVRGDNAITNQWVLPTEGLVRACLVNGVTENRDAYELGVKNLLKALDAHGPAGEFEEGFGYASFTTTSLLHVARAMAVQGDRRAVDHPFLRNFPTWLVHHFQPGDMIVNCFDAGAARGGANRSRPLLSLLASCTGSPVARWALTRQTEGPADSLPSLAARMQPPVDDGAAPPLFAAYERAARVNWRDTWKPDGTGVWVRGGHKLDQHDHRDRGHVNFISKGRPILIEAGTPFYHHPLMGSHFASGVGHNILQLGMAEPKAVNAGDTQVLPGWQPEGVIAPITVQRLDATGGDVKVEVNGGYEGLKRWTRNVAWTTETVAVRDAVELSDGQSNVILFRWHLGTNDDVTITRKDNLVCGAEWPAATLRFEASSPIGLTQVKLPDNTINTVSDDGKPDVLHTCLVVQSTDAQALLHLTSEVTARP